MTTVAVPRWGPLKSQNPISRPLPTWAGLLASDWLSSLFTILNDIIAPQTDKHIKANMITGASFHQKPQKTASSFVFVVPDKPETGKGIFVFSPPLLKFSVVYRAPFILFTRKFLFFFLILIWVHQIIIIIIISF